MLVVVRENEFIREFDWNGKAFVDSKYRTCELPFRADCFINRWRESNDLAPNGFLASEY